MNSKSQGGHIYGDHRSSGQSQSSMDGLWQGRGQGPPRYQLQHQQLPPLRQPQQPTLNLNRDFTSAEELLTTLQQFNESYDIFNNFEIPTTPFPGEDGYIAAGSLGYSNTEIDFQRINSVGAGSGVGGQYQRHQLQNNCYPPEQMQFIRSPLKLPQRNNLPPDVLALILKTQGADQLINSFRGNSGSQVEQFGQQQPPPVPQLQVKHNHCKGTAWAPIGIENTRNGNGNSRSNDCGSAPLGTASWGPPQQSKINLGSSKTFNRPDSMSTSHRTQSQPNSSTVHNPSDAFLTEEIRQSEGNLDRSTGSTPRQWSPSPFAVEFVPKSQSPIEPVVNTDALAMAIAHINFPDDQQRSNYVGASGEMPAQPNYYQLRGGGDTAESEDLSDVNDEFVLQTVTDSINRLCANPAEFSRCVKESTDVLKRHLGHADTLSIVITLLIEQGIAIPNFRYSGARLCQAFHQNGIKIGDATFKIVLLKKCEEEFLSCISRSNPDIEGDKRSQGFLMFLGELYVNFQNVTPNARKPVGVIGQATVELMTYLIQSQKQTTENIKTVAQVLKLLGWDFEHSENATVRTQMEALMKELSYILAMSGDSRAKSVIENLIELKKRDWDKTNIEDESEDLSENSSVNNSYGGATGPVLYEIPDSDDDCDYDERYLVLDDEPEDVCRFYEEFLVEAEMKRKK